MEKLEGKRYHIITFGCQMNEHDSEIMSGLLREEGCVSTDDRGNADIVIINTCSVRENADKRFFGTLGQLKKQKVSKPGFIACVCGCMMQQEHVVKEVRQSYPWVDLVFGTHNIDELPEMIAELQDNREREAAVKASTDEEKEQTPADAGVTMTDHREYSIAKHGIRSSKDSRVIRIYDDREEMVEGLPAERLYGHKAFVNIMYGCNNFCTYCIVPYTRGREKSRDPQDILNEIRKLVSDGVREVTLLGQNVNSYKGGGWDFTDLIYAVNEIDDLDRIRFMTSHPKDLSDRLIVAFGECEKLCKYIHLPVQAGSSRVLERMNRKYDRDGYIRLVEKLRARTPEITMSTDIIVGFPGETEEDFRDTLNLVELIRYDSAFTFLYSPRKGTPAAEYSDQIPEEVKHERFDRLLEVMNRISVERNSEYIGRSFRVLVDGPAKKQAGQDDGNDPEMSGGVMMSGRTDGFKLVDFPGNASMTGEMVDVRIKEAKTFSLSGELETQK